MGNWYLPEQAMFGTPVYIHSHEYSFYKNLAHASTLDQIKANLDTVIIQVGKTINHNIQILETVHTEFKLSGFGDLLDFSNSFQDLKNVKADTLVRNTISGVVSATRKKLLNTSDPETAIRN